jgi:hypothetical protein
VSAGLADGAVIVWLVVGVVALSGGASPCASPGLAEVRVHFTDAGRWLSPDCRWSVEVRPPEDTSESPAQAVLRNEETGRTRLLFRFERDWVLYWGPDHETLAVDDEAYGNHYRLLLFRPLDADQSEASALEIDRRVRSDVMHRLPSGAVIESYFPKFVRFADGRVIVSVGVITAQHDVGRFSHWCFGYAVSQTELQRQDTVTCQMDG